MKDPLQNEQTPYEFLGVALGVSNIDVDAAFKMGLAKRANVQKLTTAKRTLQNPSERAVLDLFLYNTAALNRLEPNPLIDPSVLELPKRAATAEAWEKHLRETFPDLGTIHSLAVLSYWWVLREEESLASSIVGHKKVSDLDNMWQRVIACWATLMSSEEFWVSFAGVPSDLVNQVQKAVTDRLSNKFHDLGQVSQGNGNAANTTARFQAYGLALAAERRTAEQMSRAGFRNKRGKLACGPLMLRQSGVLEKVNQQIDDGLQKNPANATLKSLRDALSVFSSIYILIEQDKPQAALDAIGALSDKDSNSEEGLRLRARALYELGKQQVSLNKFVEALGSWERALKFLRRISKREELEPKILSAIVSTCQERAAVLQQRQQDEAIAFLEMGLELVQDEKLKLTLAEILIQRGIETINNVQKEAERGKKDPTEVKIALKQGLHDLERAAKLGSKRASEQVLLARNFYSQFNSQVESGVFDLSPEAADLLVQANQAVSKGNLEDAIKLMHQAVNYGSDKSKTIVKKHLAQVLNMRAVKMMNSIMNFTQQVNKDAEKKLGSKVKSMYRWRKFPNRLFTTGGFWLLGCAAYGGYNAVSTIGRPLTLRILAALCSVSLLLLILIMLKAIWRWMMGTAALTRYQHYRGDHDEFLCDLCTSEVKYNMSLPGRGGAKFCESHAEQMQHLLNNISRTASPSTKELKLAFEDLSEAVILDPYFDQAQQNLRQLREIMGHNLG